MTTIREAQQARDRIESEYDRLIVKLDNAKTWVARSEAFVQAVEAELVAKTDERANVRLVLDGLESATSEVNQVSTSWLDAPDGKGWWWFHGSISVSFDDDSVSITAEQVLITIEVVIHDDGTISCIDDDDFELDNYHGKWKYLPLPDLPV